MCIRILQIDVQVELVFWCRADLAIYVRRDADPQTALTEIRAILTDLGAPPSAGPHHTCPCGEPIPQTPGLLAATTTTPSNTRELRYGA